jgi:hypothetical protein
MAVSTIADTIYTYRFLKLLVTPFRETEAYKLGIIDETGKRLKDKKVENQEERNAFNLFHRLVFNLKRLIETAPGGKSRLASYIAALALLREHYDVNVEKVLTEMNVNTLDKKKILKEIQPKKKKKAEEEIANTTAGVAMIPTHMKFKAFVRRKKKDDELSEEYLNELFDKPYKFKKINIALKDRKMASLTADSPQGEIRISLENFGRLGKNNFELDFSVGNRFSKTGKGDQFRIFSTVIQGLKMIIDKEKDEIKTVTFSADKEYEDDTFDAAFDGRPASKSTTNLSRARLYNTMIKKFASKMRFSVDIDDSSNRVTVYTLKNKTFKES